MVDTANISAAYDDARRETDRRWQAYRDAQDEENRLAAVWRTFWQINDGPTEHMPSVDPSDAWHQDLDR